MAGSNRRFTLAAIALPLLFLMTSGLARAATIFVNTTESGSQAAPLCTLEDAVVAANTHHAVNGCPKGDGNDQIGFMVTGTIFISNTLVIVDHNLAIFGLEVGCSGAGPCGVAIDGEGTHRIVDTENSGTNDVLVLDGLTLSEGFAPASGSGGGAIFANGTDLQISNCLIADNKAAGPTTGSYGGLGGAIYANAGTVEITNSTLADNEAVKSSPSGSEGGAIFAISAGKVVLTNDTITGNTEDFGAIVPGTGNTFLKGTILANNTNSNCIVNNPTDMSFNISDDASCAFNPAISKNSTNPMLDPAGLVNNGGPTLTVALEAGSPAATFDTDCKDQQASPETLTEDQRFYGRVNSPTTCSSGAYEFDALPPIDLVANSERVQIARSTTANSDQVNIAFTMTDNGGGSCDSGNDPLSGLQVLLAQGTCASLPNLGLILQLTPFQVHTVNSQRYGTLFVPLTPGPGNLSARVVDLPPPSGACTGSTVNIEVSGINTATYGLTGSNPLALAITDADGNTGCFDITTAIVGNQIPKPSRTVRRTRRVRR